MPNWLAEPADRDALEQRRASGTVKVFLSGAAAFQISSGISARKRCGARSSPLGRMVLTSKGRQVTPKPLRA